jgi:hypothetical protein
MFMVNFIHKTEHNVIKSWIYGQRTSTNSRTTHVFHPFWTLRYILRALGFLWQNERKREAINTDRGERIRIVSNQHFSTSSYSYSSSSLMALQPFLLGPGLLFSFVMLFTDGRTPWTSDQPVARPLPTHRTTQTQNKRTHTHNHPCLV